MISYVYTIRVQYVICNDTLMIHLFTYTEGYVIEGLTEDVDSSVTKEILARVMVSIFLRTFIP